MEERGRRNVVINYNYCSSHSTVHGVSTNYIPVTTATRHGVMC